MWDLLQDPRHLKFRQIFLASPLMCAKAAHYIDLVANANEDPELTSDQTAKYWMGMNDWFQGLSGNFFSRLITSGLS